MSLGFIIIRHVNSEQTNNLWIECYDSIRQFYPSNKILIIDDFSNYEFIDTNKILTDTLIIQSEFKGRAELLPYYYYFKNKLFDRAVVIHDSVFIQQYIDFGTENKFLWHFNNGYDYLFQDNKILNCLNEKDLIFTIFNNKNLWNGCFGVMSVINYDFLCKIEKRFNFFSIINAVLTREDRMMLERIFAIVFIVCNMFLNKDNSSLFGEIYSYASIYGGVGTTYQSYKIKKQANDINIPIVKVWTGR